MIPAPFLVFTIFLLRGGIDDLREKIIKFKKIHVAHYTKVGGVKLCSKG